MQITANAFEIDPRRFTTDRFYVGFLAVFWILWTPITLAITALAASGEEPQAFFFVWLLFGWTGVLGIPWALLTRRRRQRLEVTGEHLVLVGAGLRARGRKAIPRHELKAFTLERYGEESIWTLNVLLHGRFTRRYMLAPAIDADGKEQLFEEIAAFLRQHGFDFEARNERRPAVPQPLY